MAKYWIRGVVLSSEIKVGKVVPIDNYCIDQVFGRWVYFLKLTGPFVIGFWSSQDRVTFLGKEAVRVSTNILLVRVGLVISVD